MMVLVAFQTSLPQRFRNIFFSVSEDMNWDFWFLDCFFFFIFGSFYFSLKLHVIFLPNASGAYFLHAPRTTLAESRSSFPTPKSAIIARRLESDKDGFELEDEDDEDDEEEEDDDDEGEEVEEVEDLEFSWEIIFAKSCETRTLSADRSRCTIPQLRREKTEKRKEGDSGETKGGQNKKWKMEKMKIKGNFFAERFSCVLLKFCVRKAKECLHLRYLIELPRSLSDARFQISSRCPFFLFRFHTTVVFFFFCYSTCAYVSFHVQHLVRFSAKRTRVTIELR